MSQPTVDRAREAVDAVYRSDSRRVLATLIRLLGGFDLAEEALHEAFAAAVEQWPREGTPANPRAWLISTGRFKAIDAMHDRHDRTHHGSTGQDPGAVAPGSRGCVSEVTRELLPLVPSFAIECDSGRTGRSSLTSR